jgi:hypothetical protein
VLARPLIVKAIVAAIFSAVVAAISVAPAGASIPVPGTGAI